MNKDKDNDTLPMTSPPKSEGRDNALSTVIAHSPTSSEARTVKQNQLTLIDDRFVIERELGRGGFGVAYLAIDTKDDDHRVVIKALLEAPDKQHAAWVERKFREEVKALSRINHPGVVKLISSGEMPDGRPYLAMEFVDGDNLRSYIDPEKGIREFERIANLIRQLGEAISGAHDAGIYHRDLKPENIMVCSLSGADQVKVIDFGIATVKESLDEKTKTTALAGSVRYMAPEQIVDKPTGTSDIYTLGVIAYEMITGRVPFNPDLGHPLAAMQQLLEMQRNGVRAMPKDLRPSLPERAQEIVLKALDYQPAARYQRADEFGRELATALTDQDAEALSERYINRTINRLGSPIQYPATELNGPLGDQPAATIDEPRSARSPRWGMSCSVVVVSVCVAFGLFAWNYIKEQPNKLALSTNSPAMRSHTLSYSVSAQKYKNQKPEGEPIRLFGSELYFSTGDGLRFFIISSDNGHLYLLSEETAHGGAQYNLLFPTPKANHSSSQVQANVEIATDENLFTGNARVEKVWVVWSASPIIELENEIEKWKDKNYLGEIKDPSKVAFITNFFEQNSKANLQVEQDESNKRTTVRGTRDIIVRSLILAHR
jgi:serine/threonine protein kinase